MANVHCIKCGLDRDGMANPPFRAGTKLESLGREIQEKICSSCYKDWIAMSVKLVNESRRETTDPEFQAVWIGHMRQFLNLEQGAGDPWSRFLNTRVKVETTGGIVTHATLIGATPDALSFAEFDGGTFPAGFTASATGARGSATIPRDAVRTIETG